MRGWGIPPICKASKLYTRLGIQATHKLVEEGKEEVWWAEEDLQKNAETRAETLGPEEGLKEEQ